MKNFDSLSEDVFTYILLPFLPLIDCLKIIHMSKFFRKCVKMNLSRREAINDWKIMNSVIHKNPPEGILWLLLSESIISLSPTEVDKNEGGHWLICIIYKYSLMKNYRNLSYEIASKWVFSDPCEQVYHYAIHLCMYFRKLYHLKLLLRYKDVGKYTRRIPIPDSTNHRDCPEIVKFALEQRITEFRTNHLIISQDDSFGYEICNSISNAAHEGELQYVRKIVMNDELRPIIRRISRTFQFINILAGMIRNYYRFSYLMIYVLKNNISAPDNQNRFERQCKKLILAGKFPNALNNTRRKAIKYGLFEIVELLTEKYYIETNFREIYQLFRSSSRHRSERDHKIYKLLMKNFRVNRMKENDDNDNEKENTKKTPRMDAIGRLAIPPYKPDIHDITRKINDEENRMSDRNDNRLLIVSLQHWGGMGSNFIEFEEYNDLFIDFICQDSRGVWFDLYTTLFEKAKFYGNKNIIKLLLEHRGRKIEKKLKREMIEYTR